MTPAPAIEETPYWLASARVKPGDVSVRRDPLPASTEVLVIGGGYTGLTAAIRLKQAGTAVNLIDARQLGTAASARNGGMVLTGLTESLPTVAKKFGREMAARLFTESLESVDTVERLVAEGKIDCAFQRCGQLEAAFKPAHLDHLKEKQEYLAGRFGHTTRLIPRADLASEIDSRLYHGALLDASGAGLHPARYVAGLIAMARRAGVGLHPEVTALHIARSGTRFAVRTPQGTIAADTVVVATNGYTGRLTPWLQRRIVPTESLMIATAEMPPERACALIPRGRMVFDTKIFLFYFRLSPDGRRLLFGGRPKSAGRTVLANAASMHADMLRVFPQLTDVPPAYAWSGKLGFTWHRLPHIGRHDGVYYAMGYCGHGVALATYLGEQAAAMALGQTTRTALALLPFRKIPLYTGTPWFRPILYRYFSVMDRIA